MPGREVPDACIAEHSSGPCPLSIEELVVGDEDPHFLVLELEPFSFFGVVVY